MTRRTFLEQLMPLAAAGTWISATGRLQVPPAALTTIVLRGGRVFREGRWRTMDVGIDDAGRIRFGQPPIGATLIDVAGLTIAPGFIDLLADNSIAPDSTYRIVETYKVSDGVTTALQMHGGSADCGRYYGQASTRPHLVNHGVSTFVMAIRAGATGQSSASRLIEKNLEEGALGVSHSIEYQPLPYEELVTYARLARKYNRPFFLHLRHSSRERELEGVDEAIRVARDTGARVHIAHLHSTGGTFQMAAALDKIRQANRYGMTVTTCVYPYSYWATYLSSRRFGPGWQDRYGLTYSDLTVVGTGERLTEQSFNRYRQTSRLVSVPEGTLPLSTTVDLALKEDFCMIGSDGGIQFEPRANSHPRGAACFATAIRHGLGIGIPLEKMIDKLTFLPRSVVRPALRDRGILEEGAIADLTVFDPLTIRGNATVENPNQFSAGIEMVFVNGRLAFADGAPAARGGVAIRASL